MASLDGVMWAITVASPCGATSTVAGSNLTVQPWAAVADGTTPVTGAVPVFWTVSVRSDAEPAEADVLRRPSGVVSLMV